MQKEFADFPQQAKPKKAKKPRGNNRPIRNYSDEERRVANVPMTFDTFEKINHETPLSYFGSKKILYPYVCELLPTGTKELVSSFMGGAGLEIRLAATGFRVHAYDIFEPLTDFFTTFNGRSNEVVEQVCKIYPLSYDEHNAMRNAVPDKDGIFWQKNAVERAAIVWAINKQSFMGKTFASVSVSHDHCPSINLFQEPQWRNWCNPNITFTCDDFRNTLERHRDVIAYLDPPYVTKENEYQLGRPTAFPHEELRDILKDRGRFIMSYGDHPLIHELYKDFTIQKPKWGYNYGKARGNPELSEELLILSGDF